MSDTPPPAPGQAPPPSAAPEAQRKGCGYVLRWFFGVMFVLLGLNSPYFLVLLTWIGMGLALVPPSAAWFERKTGIVLGPGRRTLIIIGGFMFTMFLGVVMGANEPESARDRAGFWGRFYADYYSD